MWLNCVAGTGKTNTLTKLIHCLVKSKCIVHAATSTNVAICELARRYRSDITVNGTNLSRLREVILIGRQKRLKIDNDDAISDILFDKRVEDIAEVLERYEYRKIQFYNAVNRRNMSYEDFGETMLALSRIIRSAILYLPQDMVKGGQDFTPSTQSAISNLLNIPEESFNVLMDPLGLRPEHIVTSIETVQQFLSNFKIHKEGCSMAYAKSLVMDQVKVFFSTVTSSGRCQNVDVCIVDEATQMVQAATALVMRARMRCLVLAGDDKQLPATVLSKHCQLLGYGESLFSRLMKNGYESSLLTVQYRMHPVISAWPNEQFYNGHINNGENVRSPTYTKIWHSAIPPLSVYDIPDAVESKLESGSIYNAGQATVIRKLVVRIGKYLSELGVSASVGVVSPYREQVNILSHLERKEPHSITVKTGTVDGFQGQEFDIIILSTVRSNDKGVIGFLEDLRRLNVAITRARFALIVVCDTKTLSHNRAWQSYIEYVNGLNAIFTTSNSDMLKRVAREIHAEEYRFACVKDANKFQKKDIFLEAPWGSIFVQELQMTLSTMTPTMREAVIRRILNILNGEWPKRERRHQLVSVKFRDIIHIYKVDSRYIVWSVDVNQCSTTQHIKLWDVVAESNIPKCIRKVEKSFNSYTEAYLARCSYRKPKSASGKVEPHMWPHEDGFTWYLGKQTATDTTPENDQISCVPPVEQSSVWAASGLRKFFDLTSRVAHLFLTQSNLEDIELPFVMSQEEGAIVTAKKSMIILGRSGTGKAHFTDTSLVFSITTYK